MPDLATAVAGLDPAAAEHRPHEDEHEVDRNTAPFAVGESPHDAPFAALPTWRGLPRPYARWSSMKCVFTSPATNSG